MKLSIPQAGLLVLIAVIATAFVTHRLAFTGQPAEVSTLTTIDGEELAIQTHLAEATKQRAIVAELEKNYYHITYDYLLTPSSDPAPAVKRLVDNYGRDFVGKPYYIGNFNSTAGIELLSRLPSIQIVDFDDSGVTDDDLQHLKGLPCLRVLFLNGTSITETGLLHLTETPLEILHIQNCSNMDDRCVAVLSQMQSLKNLYISNRNLSANAIQQLKSALPNCNIE